MSRTIFWRVDKIQYKVPEQNSFCRIEIARTKDVDGYFVTSEAAAAYILGRCGKNIEKYHTMKDAREVFKQWHNKSEEDISQRDLIDIAMLQRNLNRTDKIYTYDSTGEVIVTLYEIHRSEFKTLL